MKPTVEPLEARLALAAGLYFTSAAPSGVPLDLAAEAQVLGFGVHSSDDYDNPTRTWDPSQASPAASAAPTYSSSAPAAYPTVSYLDSAGSAHTVSGDFDTSPVSPDPTPASWFGGLAHFPTAPTYTGGHHHRVQGLHHAIRELHGEHR